MCMKEIVISNGATFPQLHFCHIVKMKFNKVQLLICQRFMEVVFLIYLSNLYFANTSAFLLDVY